MNPNRKRKNKPHNIFQKRIKLVLLLFFLLFLATFFLWGSRGFIRYIEVSSEKEKLMKDIDRYKMMKHKLDSEKVKLNQNEYIEKVAREKYNMIKPGEKVYKIKTKAQ
jgi:cell division protein FtsB